MPRKGDKHLHCFLNSRDLNVQQTLGATHPPSSASLDLPIIIPTTKPHQNPSFSSLALPHVVSFEGLCLEYPLLLESYSSIRDWANLPARTAQFHQQKGSKKNNDWQHCGLGEFKEHEKV